MDLPKVKGILKGNLKKVVETGSPVTLRLETSPSKPKEKGPV